MQRRVGLLGDSFEQTYEADYPRLSWFVHGGLTGVAGLKVETFTYMCGTAITTATLS